MLPAVFRFLNGSCECRVTDFCFPLVLKCRKHLIPSRGGLLPPFRKGHQNSIRLIPIFIAYPQTLCTFGD